jgi:Uma2 family endonuclease
LFVSSAITKFTTADELLAMPDDGFRYELIEGELIRMSLAGAEHGAVAVNIAAPLSLHVRTHKLGTVYAADTGFKLQSDPDTVRGPDVAFVTKKRVVEAGPGSGYLTGAPDFAVEVLSPNDSKRKTDAKAKQWLNTGARLVWVVDPRKATVTVYRSLTEIFEATTGDILDGGDVVPGFQLAVADIFSS